MTKQESNKPRMTCGTWLVIVVFGGFALAWVSLSNVRQAGQDVRAEWTQGFFDALQADNHQDAYDMVALEWQPILENADGLATTFEDITVADVRFNGRTGTCNTNVTFQGDRTILNEDSKRYQFYIGTATINDREDEYILVRFTTEDFERKILGVVLGEEEYGEEIPNDCYYD